MLLTYQGVRTAAKNWQTYSSDAPFRVPIPSEENQRSVRQLPIETDPPEHRAYRALLEPIFRRPMQADYIAAMDGLVRSTLLACLDQPALDIVRGLALPLQSRALALLLGVPQSEAETWISWGTHVFHDGDDPEQKGADLEAYLMGAIEAGRGGEDPENFFTALHRLQIDGRTLTDAERLGMANLVFAGGRDTVIAARLVSGFPYAGPPQTTTRKSLTNLSKSTFHAPRTRMSALAAGIMPVLAPHKRGLCCAV